MTPEFELLREFRAADQVVSAAARDDARAALMARIAGAAQTGARRRPPPHRRVPRVAVPGVLAALGVAVMVAVVVLALSAGHRDRPAAPARHGGGVAGPPVVHNLGGPVPQLPGQLVCDADLARPGAIPGGGGSPSGVVTLNAYAAHGINYLPFSIIASGLPATAPGDADAVWLEPAVSTTFNGDQLIRPVVPVLLGVIRPAVRADGRLRALGQLAAISHGTYLLILTRQAHAQLRVPGSILLEGFVVL